MIYDSALNGQNLIGTRFADVFRYDATSDSPKQSPDTISFNHSQGDKIDLTQLPTLGDHALHWAGTTPTGADKEFGIWQWGDGTLRIDVDGDRQADMSINMLGRMLTTNDFIINVPTTPTEPPTTPTEPPVTEVPATAESKILELINTARTTAGASALQTDTELNYAAAAHVADMQQNHYFSHLSPDSSSPGDRITASNYDWTSVGENLAYVTDNGNGVIDDAEIQLLHDNLMNSPGHNANIVREGFSEVGLKFDLSNGRIMLAEDFGTPTAGEAAEPDKGTFPAAPTAVASLPAAEPAGTLATVETVNPAAADVPPVPITIAETTSADTISTVAPVDTTEAAETAAPTPPSTVTPTPVISSYAPHTIVAHETFDGGLGTFSETYGNVDTSTPGQVTLTSAASESGDAWMMLPGQSAEQSAESGHGYGKYEFALSFSNDVPGPYALLFPASGTYPGPEIDVVESLPDGQEYSTVRSNNNGDEAYTSYFPQNIDSTQPHVYSVNWQEDSLDLSIDGVMYAHITNNVPKDATHGGENLIPVFGVQTPSNVSAENYSDISVTVYDFKFSEIG